MGHVREYYLKQLESEAHTETPQIKGKTGIRKKLVEGQIGIESLGISLDSITEMPKIRIDSKTQGEIKTNEGIKKNVIEEISDDDLPAEKRYLDNRQVAFLDPKNIPYIKNNILKIGKKGILVDSIKFCTKTDEDIVKSLVVFPKDTSLYDVHNRRDMVFRGGIIALPLKTTENWDPEQRFIYIGNFSDDEKRSQKDSTAYYFIDNKKKINWRNINIGQELPANANKALRAQISVAGKNETKFN